MNKYNVKQGEQSRDRILKAIAEFINKNQHSPSVRELCAMTGFKTTSTVQHHLIKLADEGLIEMGHSVGIPRALRISDKGRKRLEEMKC